MNRNATGNRRDFVRETARTAGLAVLATVGVLLTRRPASRLANQRCINQGLCRGCGKFAACGLPQALSVRQAGKGG